MTPRTISVIIPTFRRPELLRETIESVWTQTRLPDEILIGDDSPDDSTARLVADELIPASAVPIRYFHHDPALTEAKNVDALYTLAGGTHILHLHDDDPILPGCLEVLSGAFDEHPEAVAAFGMQKMMEENGTLLPEMTDGVNRAYFRTPDRAGLVDGFFAGAVSMLPNNGFLVEAAAARSIGYDDRGQAGRAVDYYFGLSLGGLRRPMVFVPEYTGWIRLTTNSESRNASADNSFQRMSLLLGCLQSEEITPDIATSIRHHLPFAIANAAQLGKSRQGWKWFFSPHFRNRLVTPTGVKCALRLVGASLKLDPSPAR